MQLPTRNDMFWRVQPALMPLSTRFDFSGGSSSSPAWLECCRTPATLACFKSKHSNTQPPRVHIFYFSLLRACIFHFCRVSFFVAPGALLHFVLLSSCNAAISLSQQCAAAPCADGGQLCLCSWLLGGCSIVVWWLVVCCSASVWVLFGCCLEVFDCLSWVVCRLLGCDSMIVQWLGSESHHVSLSIAYTFPCFESMYAPILLSDFGHCAKSLCAFGSEGSWCSFTCPHITLLCCTPSLFGGRCAVRPSGLGPQLPCCTTQLVTADAEKGTVRRSAWWGWGWGCAE